MIEYSTFTSITGADGTVVSLNGASGLVLTDCSGFDSPNIRTNIADLPETDGAAAGNSFFGQRPITLTGQIIGLDAATRNTLLFNLMRALRGLRSDCTIQATPTGQPAMQVSARVASLRVTGQWMKQVQIQAICADPLLYSQTLHSSTTTQAQTPAAPGASFSWAFPINWGGGGGAYSCALNVTNAGNFTAPVVLQCTGPITSPQFTDATSGLSIYVDGLTLDGSTTLTIDTNARTCVDSNGNNWYSKVRFPGSTWFGLDPGSSSIQLWGTGTTSATQLQLQWRDAWA